jgi:hypothetical protein
MGDEETNMRVDEMNALALAANIADHRATTDTRFTALENQVASLSTLVQNQSRVIGEFIQRVAGSGSTEPDPHPEDTR